ncbi:MAG: hypothetical protein GY835_03020 [bacterium]|nr:hypothetical protein [bacterium]
MDDSITQWVELIAQYGPFALFVFFALPLWAIAKRNVDTAKDDETRRYYLRNHRNITLGIFALALVTIVAWGYKQLYIEPSKPDRAMIEGNISGLKHYRPEVSNESSGVTHSVGTVGQIGRFYARKKEDMSEDYTLQWAFVNDTGPTDLMLTFVQTYREKKSERMTDTTLTPTSGSIRGRQRGSFRLDLTADDAISGEPYSLVYYPHADEPLGKLGVLKRVVEGRDPVPLKWIASLPSAPSPPPEQLWPSLISAAWAAPPPAAPLFDGKRDEYIVRRLAELLSSERIDEQLTGLNELRKHPDDARRFIDMVLTKPPSTILDDFTFWSNVSDLAKELDGTPIALDPEPRQRIIDALMSTGAYEEAARQIRELGAAAAGPLFKPVALNRLPAEGNDGWVSVPRRQYKHLNVTYYMAPHAFYGDGCVEATYMGGDFDPQETRPRYCLSLWRDDARQGYEFFLGLDADGSRETEFTIYKRFSVRGPRPVTKLNRGWGRHETIQPFVGGVNKLAICRVGQSLRFFANNKLLFEHSEPEPERHRFTGIDVATGTQVFLRDFGICLRSDCGYVME